MRLYRLPLLFILTAMLNACALFTEDLKTPQISLVNIKPKKIGLLKQHFQLRLKVKNPNSVTLPIRGWHYKLQLAEHEFAKGSSDQEIDIPAHGETQIDVDIDAELTKLLRLLNADRRNPLIYRLNGDVGVAAQALQMPFKAEGKIKLKF